MSQTVRELAALVGGEVVGDPATRIEGVAGLDTSPVPPHSILWIGQAALLPKAEHAGAACIIVPRSVAAAGAALIRVAHPKIAFARILTALYPPAPAPAGVHPSSVMGRDIRLGRDVSIGAHVVVGDRVTLGDRVVLGAGTVVGDDCVIGAEAVIHANVTLYHHTQVGARVIIHAGCVIGGDGFGFVMDPATRAYVKIPQIGIVIIEDDVELGSNVTIDRATIGATIIRRGVKVDNLVQIAHNVIVGEHTAISAQSGIAGSASVGDHCVLAGQSGVADHAIVEADVTLGAQTAVISGKRIRRGQFVWGIPARPLDVCKRQQAALSRLPQLRKDVMALRKALRDAGIAVPTSQRASVEGGEDA